MNELYELAFQCGVLDCQGGEHFDSRKSKAWQEGWKFANANRKR